MAQESYPSTRLRRLRMNAATRSMVQETHLHAEDFIYPLFLTEGHNIKLPIASIPGQYVYSVDQAKIAVQELWTLGIKSILLFSRTDHKDPMGSASHASSAAMQKGIYAIKSAVPDMMVISDVCLCPYTSHGHCGLVGDYHGRSIVENDSTLEVLNDIAISHAQAGVDVVAPSGNMDGMVQSIRKALDQVNHWPVAILSYSAKYASSLYGPFREAVDCAPHFGDRKTYQLNPANRLEALREIKLDIQEGADMIIVKPALSFLDIIREARDCTEVPVVGYQVSGEYSMIKAASEKGWLNDTDALYESLLCIKRAGANMIVTYAAPEMAKLLSSRTS